MNFLYYAAFFGFLYLCFCVNVDANRTVTIETHPHRDIAHASIHPCQHAAVMKRIMSQLVAGGKVLRVDQVQKESPPYYYRCFSYYYYYSLRLLLLFYFNVSGPRCVIIVFIHLSEVYPVCYSDDRL